MVGMTSHIRPMSRRTLLRGGTAVAALALLPSCDAGGSVAATSPTTVPPHTASASTGSSAAAVPNVRVSDDRYGVHVEPSVAANPRNPRQLLAAAQVSPGADPEFLATYLSSDAGLTWHPGAVPRLPVGANGDDVTVAFDVRGRGYVCATSDAGGRAIYVWRTDDGGRTFSLPVTVLEDQYCDHPWLATGQGRTASERNVYVVWGAGNARTAPALDFARSTDGGQSFEPPRRILAASTVPSDVGAGPEIATAPGGLVCAVCDWTTKRESSGDQTGQVVAVCSTDWGQSFAAPVQLGSESSVVALPGGVMPNSGPTVAASAQGSLYVAFPQHRAGDHSDIVVVRSEDRGRTWSQPVSATPADGATYFQPNLAVDDMGRVGISAFALTNGRVEQVLLLSQPGELHFQPPVRVSSTAFNPHTPTGGGKHGAWWVGDYQGITASDGAFHLIWNDARSGKLDLYAASVRP
jgi:BNR repeat-like domain/TAT (twin-arginine translocation) pathway signal sequence